MMKAAVGSRCAVTGSSSAIVSAGPIPGRIPIAVPSVTPRNAHPRFTQVSAVANPSKRAPRACITHLQDAVMHSRSPLFQRLGLDSYNLASPTKKTAPPLAGGGRGRGVAPAGAHESCFGCLRRRCDRGRARDALPRADPSPCPLPQGEGEFFHTECV